MLGPFATASRLFYIAIHQVSLLSHAATVACRQNWSFHCGDVAILRIFKMATTAILVCWNREILLAIWMARVETHQRAKFCQNRSTGRKDIMMFQFFKMAANAILDFRNGEFLFADGILRPRRITISNFVKIGCSFAEILRFFEFSRWPPPPSWIFEIAKFYWLLESRLSYASACQISSKSVNRLRRN